MNFYVLDKYGMCLTRGGTHGHENSIGGTVLLAIAKDDPSLMAGPLKCIQYLGGTIDPKIKIWRHPSCIGHQEHDTLSRDHYVYLCCGLLYFGMNDILEKVIKQVSWRLSEKYTQTIDLWLWGRSVIGNKWAGILFYMIFIPTMLVSCVWNWALTKKGKFSKEMSEREYTDRYPLPVTEYQKKVRKKFYPTYALAFAALQIYLMKKSIGKWITKRVMRPMVGRTSLYLKLLTGMKVTKEEVDNYPPMRGGRLTTYLSERNDRFTIMLKLDRWEDSEYLDKKLIETLYNYSLNQ